MMKIDELRFDMDTKIPADNKMNNPTGEDFVPKCVKYSVYFMNFLFWVLAVFSIGVGLHVHYEHIKPIQDLLNTISNPAVLVIALGIMLFAAATAGCIGSNRENLEILRVYLLGLLFLLMANIAMGMVCFMMFTSSKPLKEGVHETLRSGVVNYEEDTNLALYLNALQSSLHCCGIGRDGYRDWLSNPYYACHGKNLTVERCSVPSSCCKEYSIVHVNSMCGRGVTNDSVPIEEAAAKIYTKGCVVKIEESLQSGTMVLGVLAFGVAIPLLCGLLLGGRMIINLQEKVEDYYKKYEQQNSLNPERYNITEPKTLNVIRPPMYTA